MAKSDWEKVVEEKELEEGVPRSFTIGKRHILLIRIDERIYASGARCPHYGAPLDRGILMGETLICPRHTAAFNVTNGRMILPPALDDLKRYLVKIEDHVVYVKRADAQQEPVDVKVEKGTFVIIGSGAAGSAAALTLRKEGFDGRVIIVTEDADLPYDRTVLSKEFLSGDMDQNDIFLKNERVYRDLRIEIFSDYKVMDVDTNRKMLLFVNSQTMHYDKLLIATGGIPRTPNIYGVELPNFFLLRSWKDASAIVSAIKSTGRVVIIGAGFIGLETAASLRSKNLEVHVIDPEDPPLKRVFGEEIGSMIKKLHEENGVIFHLGVTPEEILGESNIREVLLSNESRVQADIVIAGIGIVPAVYFLEGTGLAENNAVPVDGRLKTKNDDVYAAGDVALVPDLITGKKRRTEHWAEAQRQGQHAARSMLGFRGEYEELPFFWTEQYGKVIQYIGHSERFDHVVLKGDLDGDFIAGYFKGRSLEAAAGIGHIEELVVIGEILKRGTRISPAKFRDEKIDLKELLKKT